MKHDAATTVGISADKITKANDTHFCQMPTFTGGWRITFWGTGDSMGVPRVYCTCGVCEEARQNGMNRRYRASVLMERGEDRLLIDCGPDWNGQMERAGLFWLDELLITHAHQDHIAGLPMYADACRWLGRRGRVITPTEVSNTICTMYPWLTQFMTFQSIRTPWRWHEWSIRPIKVNHGKNGFSFAYRFDPWPGTKQNHDMFLPSWLYAPDAIGLGTKELRWFQKLDLLILGANFYHEKAQYSTRSVYDMVEALQLKEMIQPKQMIFTHMSHDIDLRRSYPLPPQVILARTGMQIGR